jgi:hypothetical protein
VIDNIKGNLHGNVTVDQQGGYKDGVLYVVDGDTLSSSTPALDYMLHPGWTYLFATRYNKDQKWYTLNPYPTASMWISRAPTISDSEVRALDDKIPRIQALRAAYPNEILIDADVKHNNALNSHKSLAGHNPAQVTDATVQ